MEGVGEEPLDEGVVALESLVVAVPLGMHLLDELPAGLRGHLVEVKFNVQVHFLLRLRLEGRRDFALGDNEGGVGGSR